jgi:hypothetical protein
MGQTQFSGKLLLEDGTIHAPPTHAATTAEFKTRVLVYLDGVNREPAIHPRTYEIGEAAS